VEGFVAILFLAAAAWFFLTALMSGGRNRDVYRQLAREFQGTAHQNWFSLRMVRFRHGDSKVVVLQERRRRVGRYTDVWLEWPDAQLILHVAPTSMRIDRRFMSGMHILDSADDAFFWRFRVYTNDPHGAAQILNETVKWHIEHLRQQMGNRGVELRISRGHVLIRKQCWFRDLKQLSQFTRTALNLYDQMLVTNVAGIEFVSAGELQPLEDVVCQICGETIVTDMVFCRRCKTPHHGECWDYTGVCSVYGCRETEHVTPRIAARETGG
jgi:hypothetical protein